MTYKIDFWVKYDPSTEPPEELARKILYSIFIRRTKKKKPVVAAVIAPSGEGKSYGVNKLVDELMSIQGIDLVKNIDYFDTLTIANPLQYAEKLDKILYNKEYKKLNVMAIHESRTVVSAKNWRSFVNTAIADVNAMSRAIKPLMFFFISQAFKDIDSNVRSTLTHYISIERPLSHEYSTMQIYNVWHDERDIEKPKYRKSIIKGIVQLPDGRQIFFTPTSLRLKWLRKPLQERFEKLDYEGKTVILKDKMTKIMNEIKAEVGDDTSRINSLVDFYMQDTDKIGMIAKRNKKGWKIKSDMKDLHNFTATENKLFEKVLNQKLKDSDMMREEEGEKENV